MKKLLVISLVVLLVLGAVGIAYAWGVKCPIDGFRMYFTGQKNRGVVEGKGMDIRRSG